MSNYKLAQKSNLDRDVIFKISTDVENFHKIMPKYFKSMKIISYSLNEKIVLVAVFSKHRDKSEKACTMLMDYLKKDAPFWKKEEYNNKKEWL